MGQKFDEIKHGKGINFIQIQFLSELKSKGRVQACSDLCETLVTAGVMIAPFVNGSAPDNGLEVTVVSMKQLHLTINEHYKQLMEAIVTDPVKAQEFEEVYRAEWFRYRNLEDDGQTSMDYELAS